MTDSVAPLPTVSGSPQFLEKGRPSAFQRPTLGHVVCLGELFDERKNQFLGIQLYKDKAFKNTVTITDSKSTDLTLSRSNSIKDKSNVLGINASLSLDVLAALVTPSGSASYLRAPTTNSQERSWAMALKVRTGERRLRFAELPDSEAVEAVKEGYPDATHFVSAITYGGAVVISMTERSSNLTEERNLRLELEQLKAAISLCKGDAVADAKVNFKSLDDKLDLKVYGDIELDKTPSSAKDVLDIIPHTVDLICGNPRGVGGSAAGANNTEVKGVPIFVTLQPIPAKLQRGAQINLDVIRLKPSVVDQALSIFGKLDDLHNRFTTLVGSTTTHRKFIPQLADRVQVSFDAFDEEYCSEQQSLGQFLRDIQHSDEKRMEVNNESYSFSKAKKLYTTHTTATDTTKLLIHQFPFICLEKSFNHFQNLVHNIGRVPSGVKDQHGDEVPSRLSTIDDVRNVPCHQTIIPLFVMTPSLDHDDDNSAVIRFIALLRNHKTIHPRYLVYLEDPSDEKVLPCDAKVFLNLDGPAYFLGRVNTKGYLIWTRDEEDLIRVRPPPQDVLKGDAALVCLMSSLGWSREEADFMLRWHDRLWSPKADPSLSDVDTHYTELKWYEEGLSLKEEGKHQENASTLP